MYWSCAENGWVVCRMLSVRICQCFQWENGRVNIRGLFCREKRSADAVGFVQTCGNYVYLNKFIVCFSHSDCSVFSHQTVWSFVNSCFVLVIITKVNIWVDVWPCKWLRFEPWSWINQLLRNLYLLIYLSKYDWYNTRNNLKNAILCTYDPNLTFLNINSYPNW